MSDGDGAEAKGAGMIVRQVEVVRTRYGETSWTGCAGTSSWTLRSVLSARWSIALSQLTYWPWRLILLCSVVGMAFDVVIRLDVCSFARQTFSCAR